MYNGKKYDISDVAQPSFVYKNNGYVNPAYPEKAIVFVDKSSVEIQDFEFMDALKHRLKRARKKKDKKQIRAVEAMMKEIKEYEGGH